MANDVFEYLVNGTSGIVAGDVSGSVLIVGVCSMGTVGKIYYLDKRSKLTSLLGAGPLVDRLNDLFTNCGQDATVLAVPVSGSPAGYIGALTHTGDGPEASTSGLAVDNADVVILVTGAGAAGVAKVKVSTDDGDSFGDETLVPENGQITIDGVGVTVVLEDGDLVVDDTYSFVVRSSIGPIEQVGTGPEISAAGTVTRAAQVIVQIVKDGGLNEGQYRLSTDGGDNYGAYKTIPVDGGITIDDTGVTVTCPAEDYVAGTEYNFDLQAPVPSISTVIETLQTPIEKIDPEFIHLCGPSDSVDWVALGSFVDDLWGKHRPTFVTCEARLPQDDETLDDWVTALKAEKDGVAHDFVSVCAGYGEIINRTGESVRRNAGGLLVGRLLSISVQRAIGRVRDGAVSALSLPDDYTESMQSELETAGFVTAKTYASQDGVFWGDAKTLADSTSDFQYIEVLRTVFKAVRLLRVQALKSMYDELGDPVLGIDASGLVYMRTNLGNALDTMVKAKPKELAAYVIEIPDNQDFLNNGVAVEPTLIGIPIIRTIKLYCNYTYAGSAFDPRLAA